MKRSPIPGATVVVAIAAPVAMAFETGIRLAFFPARFQEVREALHDTLRPWAWGTIGLVIALGCVGCYVLSRIGRALVERTRDEGWDKTGRLLVGKFMLTTSIPQIPAIAGTFMFMLGSPLLPILICMAVSSSFVVAQGLLASRLLGPNPENANANSHGET